MKIFIVGAGEVGVHIASSLIREYHDLVIIERDTKKVSTLSSSMDILAVAGDGCDPRLLARGRVHRASHLVAVCGADGTNVDIAVQTRAVNARRRRGSLSCLVHLFDNRHHPSSLLLSTAARTVPAMIA